MKKTFILTIMLLMIPAGFIFCNDLSVLKNTTFDTSIKKIDFTSGLDSQNTTAFDLTKRYATSTSKKEKVFSVIGFVGLGNFVGIYAFYLIFGFIGTPMIGLALDAEDDTWRPLFGIMATSWIPFLGPLIGTGMLDIMANTKGMSPVGYAKSPYSFYGPIMACLVMIGLLEIPFFIMMVVGFVGRQKAKNDTVSMILETDNKGNKIVGLSVAF